MGKCSEKLFLVSLLVFFFVLADSLHKPYMTMIFARTESLLEEFVGIGNFFSSFIKLREQIQLGFAVNVGCNQRL